MVRLAAMRRALVRGLAAALLVATAAACYGGHQQRPFATNTGGSIERGAAVMRNRDCGSCHVIPGIVGADGLVAPPLTRMARRNFIAGRVPNRPEMMVRWLMRPYEVDPMTAMPDLGLDEREARDVMAYLYTLR
jgi:cytochrome c2